KHLLENQPSGSFIVRNNGSEVDSYKLSFKSACSLLYLGQFSVGTQSAGYAIKMCVDHVLGRSQLSADPTVIEFRVNENGITMTDLSQRKFSQRHYPTDFLQFIGVDPLKR
ncbi:hypothetical protein X801_05383, partial [Opisthorchis viverrini]